MQYAKRGDVSGFWRGEVKLDDDDAFRALIEEKRDSLSLPDYMNEERELLLGQAIALCTAWDPRDRDRLHIRRLLTRVAEGTDDERFQQMTYVPKSRRRSRMGAAPSRVPCRVGRRTRRRVQADRPRWHAVFGRRGRPARLRRQQANRRHSGIPLPRRDVRCRTRGAVLRHELRWVGREGVAKRFSLAEYQNRRLFDQGSPCEDARVVCGVQKPYRVAAHRPPGHLCGD